MIARVIGVLVFVVLWSVPGWAQPVYVGGASASASSTTPSVTYTTTAGNLIFVGLGSGTHTGQACTAPTVDWLPVDPANPTGMPVFNDNWHCAFYRIADGGDSLAFTMAASGWWSMGVAEFDLDGATGELVAMAQRAQNATSVSSGSAAGVVTSGDLVISFYGDGAHTVGPTPPSGYDLLILSPATDGHYGTTSGYMGAMAWRVAVGSSENAAWTRDSGYAGVGVYVFGAGGDPAPEDPETELIPAARLSTGNWSCAGMLCEGGIPARPIICSTIAAATYGSGASNASAGIQAAINACPDGQTVLLGAGSFRIEAPLTIYRSHVTLRGSGMGVTILVNPDGAVAQRFHPSAGDDLDTANGDETGIISVAPASVVDFRNTGTKQLTVNGVQGASTVTLSDVTGLTTGQYVLLTEDHFSTATWATKPLSSGAANAYEVLGTDRVIWAKHRNILTNAVTTVTSNASTEEITTNTPHGLSSGRLVYFNGHSGVFSPSDSANVYRVLAVISPTVFTLQEKGDKPSPVLVTTGSTSGTIESTRPGDNMAPGPVHPTNSALGWHCRGYGHCYGEIKRITGIVGKVVTFESPLTDSYRTAYDAELAVSTHRFVAGVGVEDMTLHRGARGALVFNQAAKSWAKNIEVYEYYDPGISLNMSYRVEVVGSYVRYAAWRYPGGGGYALRMSDQTSEALIWNNIFVDANKNMASNAAGAGSVVAYNHTDDSAIQNFVIWQEVGLNGGHFPGSHHMLFEGNYGVNFDNDFTHGSTIRHTVARNWLSGQRASYTDSASVRTIGLMFGSVDFSFVGNVLGRSGSMSGWTVDAGDTFGSGSFLYNIGYDAVESTQHADPNVTGSLIDLDNYNYLANGIRDNADPFDVPNSLFLTAAPSFFQSCTWPWVDPVGTTKLYTLPARARYLGGTPLDVTTDPCVAGPRGAPARLRTRGE